MGYTKCPWILFGLKQTKSLAKLSDIYMVLGLSLVGPLSGLHRVVRVGYVCLFPGPPQLVAHLLPDEVVLT